MIAHYEHTPKSRSCTTIARNARTCELNTLIKGVSVVSKPAKRLIRVVKLHASCFKKKKNKKQGNDARTASSQNVQTKSFP